MIVANCKSCGQAVSWGITPKGKKMPLNVPQISDVRELRRLTGEWTHARGLYIFVGSENDIRPAKLADVMYGQGEAVYLTHYATCPQAKEWRKGDGV